MSRDAWFLRGASPILRRLDRLFPPRESYLEVSILLIALSLAFLVRTLPGRWGLLLSEFDPWWHFKIANFIIERGWGGFAEFAGWVDTRSWYPTGLPVGRVFYPGVSFTMAFIYLTLASLGISVEPMSLAAMLPPIYGALAVLGVYLLAKRVAGPRAALAAALFLAVSASHISRSTLGWFDDESLSIPLMLGGYVAYLAAIDHRRSRVGAVSLGLLSGLLIGYMVASWGAHKFPVIMVPLFTALLVFMDRYHSKMLLAYIPTIGAYTLIAISVPKLGSAYLREVTMLAGFVVLGYLLLNEALRRLLGHERSLLAVRAAAVLLAVAFIATAALGAVGIPGLKFFSVLAPWLRDVLPIVISVAENQPATWAAIFQDFGPLLLLAPYGLYLMIRRGTNEAIFVALFAVFTFYFASSLVRLSLLAGPAIVILAGCTFASMLEAAGKALREPPTRRRVAAPRGLLIVPLILFITFSIYYLPIGLGNQAGLSPIDLAYSPQTIVTSSVPARQLIPDWIRTVEWMRNNLPADAVVASWWDYGDWITIAGNRTSLIDNTTIDSRRIARVGYAFMSPENVSYRVFREMGATHVLIFVTHRPAFDPNTPPALLGFGDEAKWIWMLRIANQEAEQLGIEKIDEQSLLGPRGNTLNPSDRFWSETTLGLLIPFKPEQFGNQVGHIYQEPSLAHYRLVYSSSPPMGSIAYVYIYELVP